MAKKMKKAIKVDANSIVDYLKAKGAPSDMRTRKAIAKRHGIIPYSGTAEQNIKLLALLRKKAKAKVKVRELALKPKQAVRIIADKTMLPVAVNVAPNVIEVAAVERPAEKKMGWMEYLFGVHM